jgi:hypothetical protein
MTAGHFSPLTAGRAAATFLCHAHTTITDLAAYNYLCCLLMQARGTSAQPLLEAFYRQAVVLLDELKRQGMPSALVLDVPKLCLTGPAAQQQQQGQRLQQQQQRKGQPEAGSSAAAAAGAGQPSF